MCNICMLLFILRVYSALIGRHFGCVNYVYTSLVWKVGHVYEEFSGAMNLIKQLIFDAINK